MTIIKHDPAAAERVRRCLAIDIEAFLNAGGQINSLPGFRAVQPLPIHREPEVKKKKKRKVKQEPIPAGYLTADQLCGVFDITYDSFRNGVNSGRFPAHAREQMVNAKVRRLWLKTEVERYFDTPWSELERHLTAAKIADLAGISRNRLISLARVGIVPAAPATMRRPIEGPTPCGCSIVQVWPATMARDIIKTIKELDK